jgi:NhaA family Na+:H+ antiporter
VQENRPTPALLRPFQTFFRLESASGILLLVSAVLALIWANSPLSPFYFGLWETNVTASVGGFAISKPLLLWINDGLMAIFFFVVGLEIKREVMVGELASPKKAALSIAAAVGGMLVPAGIFALLNSGGAGSSGWGIPMATDIAFTLGVLALLGRRVPLALKVFVTAVAIVDDLGAVLVIAIFYTEKLSMGSLALATMLFAAVLVLNFAGVRRVWPYGLLGLALWVAFLKSGVHATIAGVLLAMSIPARRLIDAPQFLERAELYLSEIREDIQRTGRCEPTQDQIAALHSLEDSAEKLQSPLARLEHELHPLVAFFIMPVFALANAGVALRGNGTGIGEMLVSPVALGVILGLFFGKQIGIFAASWLAVKIGVAALPDSVRWHQLWGVAVLCGIGFTMSLFIAGLAFADLVLLDEAKVGILAGSFVSALAGSLVLAKMAGRHHAS